MYFQPFLVSGKKFANAAKERFPEIICEEMPVRRAGLPLYFSCIQHVTEPQDLVLRKFNMLIDRLLLLKSARIIWNVT